VAATLGENMAAFNTGNEAPRTDWVSWPLTACTSQITVLVPPVQATLLGNTYDCARLMASCGFRYPVSRLAQPELASFRTAVVPGHAEAGSANVANTSA
jgi:hypothetical protein